MGSRVDSTALQSLSNLLFKQGLTKPELQDHYSSMSGLRPFRDGIDIDAVFLAATDTIRDEICASRDIGPTEADIFAKYTVHVHISVCWHGVPRPSVPARPWDRERALPNPSEI